MIGNKQASSGAIKQSLAVKVAPNRSSITLKICLESSGPPIKIQKLYFTSPQTSSMHESHSDGLNLIILYSATPAVLNGSLSRMARNSSMSLILAIMTPPPPGILPTTRQ